MDSRIKGLLGLLVIVLAVLVVVTDGKRRAAEDRLAQLMVQTGQDAGNAEANKERAKEIVDSVKRHFTLPAEDGEPTVAAIVDVDELRKQNAFYNRAENGDYLVITTSRAVLYDPDADVVIDVAPVQVQQPDESAAAPVQK